MVTAREDTPTAWSGSGLAHRFGRWLCAPIDVAAEDLAGLRTGAASVVTIYLLHRRSFADLIVLSNLLVRAGLPGPSFAAGFSRPTPGPLSALGDALRVRIHRGSPSLRSEEDALRALGPGESAVLFLRAPTGRAVTRRDRLDAARPAARLVAELVTAVRRDGRAVRLVPVSVARGRVFPRRTASATAAYALHQSPGDLRRLTSYVFARRDLHAAFGRPIDLGSAVARGRDAGAERLARQLVRQAQTELAQDQRRLLGPVLQPRDVLAEGIFESPDFKVVLRQVAEQRGVPERKVAREARRHFWEIAANPNGFAFGLVERVFHQIWKRAFSGLEVRGLERVEESVRRHPVVLVPCHRSHFDYMVLSYIFREHFLSPPHIAAGINLSFFPIGSLLRGGGAFFIHRSFGSDDLYRLVFDRYLGALIREGYTLEFFIEGGRSRTGKMLPPKLGMLGAIVSEFARSGRRDLHLVPVSVHYGRIAEESAYGAELSGEAKPRESFGALLRARSVLKQRHGTAYVSFAEPISLRDELGDRLAPLSVEAPVAEAEQKRFVQKLGLRLLREANAVAVVGATSLSATVLLSAGGGRMSLADFKSEVRLLAEVLRWQAVSLTPALERNLGAADFSEVTAFLESAGLVESLATGERDDLRVPPAKRMALDFYKNNCIHYFLVPAVVADAWLRRVPAEGLEAEVGWWLDLLRWEFPLPEKAAVGREAERIAEYLFAHGASFERMRTAAVPPLVKSLAGVLENFREAYWIAARTVARLDVDSISEAQLVARMKRHFEAARLLGEVVRVEGATPAVFRNAIARLLEIGALEVRPGKSGRDRILGPGGEAAIIEGVSARLSEAIGSLGRPNPVAEKRGGQPPMRPGVDSAAAGS